ncbi:LexA family transcriptional regulator [Novosphingobium sp. Rr 2-17]|uniref:LexA family transcriptional regulator n=1 Tax=Novosphingobium sp. Rr 2-17 TaxID=555793 RepID=UPI0002EBE685|nr:LexA family transcriptional regulator [Novosphingobium sp. Rr 2-17]
MESPDPRERLLQLAERRGASLSALSRLVGKNPSYLQQFVRKGSPRKLEEQDRATLARFFGVDEEQLGKSKDISSASNDPAPQTWIDVPRLMQGVSAGHGAMGEGEHAFDAVRFSARWLRSMGLEPRMLSAITVQGDSMEPTLRDGDEILVDRSLRPPRDGIHVVRLDDILLVKRLDMGRAGMVMLVSDNAAYRAIECRLDEVQVIGRVVWKGGRI